MRVEVNINNDVTVKLMQAGADVLNAKLCTGRKLFKSGDEYTTQFWMLLQDFDGDLGNRLEFGNITFES